MPGMAAPANTKAAVKGNQTRALGTHPSRAAVATVILIRLGISKPSRIQIAIMVAWMTMEGGAGPQFGVANNHANYNPFNTTLEAPGATNQAGGQGNIKSYRNWDEGIDANVKTLEDPRYRAVLAAIKAGNISQWSKALKASPWDAGHYAGTDLVTLAHRFTQGPDAKEALGGDDASAIQHLAAGPAGDVVDAATEPLQVLGKLGGYLASPQWWGKIGMYAAGILMVAFGLILFARDFSPIKV